MSDFLSMGGYAFYIWPSYIVSIAILVLLAVLAYRFLGTQEKTLEELDAAQDTGQAETRKAEK